VDAGYDFLGSYGLPTRPGKGKGKGDLHVPPSRAPAQPMGPFTTRPLQYNMCLAPE
jgi:hypothetical protein